MKAGYEPTSKAPCPIPALPVVAVPATAERRRWTEAQAEAWYRREPWLVGSNYIPATAINELEMWQADTFDPKRIDLELGWAESLGLNTMRVFLHDLLWQQDPQGFTSRIRTFLAIADNHHIRILFVLFDSCWDPNPHLGPQREPKPGVHNSGWVQSPGAAALLDPAALPRLEAYVKGVVGAFGTDPRVLGWDVWNEPDNVNTDNYKDPANKSKAGQCVAPRSVCLVPEIRCDAAAHERHLGGRQNLAEAQAHGDRTGFN